MKALPLFEAKLDTTGVDESVAIMEKGKFILNADGELDFVENGSQPTAAKKPAAQTKPRWDEPINKTAPTAKQGQDNQGSMVDIISSQTPDNNDNKLATTIDNMGKAAETGDKVKITAAYKAYLAELKKQLGLTDKELIKYITDARKMAQASVLSATDNKKSKEFSTSIEVMNDTLRELGVDVSGATSAADSSEPKPVKRKSPKVNPDAWTKFGKTFADITNIKVNPEPTSDTEDKNVEWYNIVCKDTKGRSLTMLVPVETEDVKQLMLNSINREGMKALKNYLIATYKK